MKGNFSHANVRQWKGRKKGQVVNTFVEGKFTGIIGFFEWEAAS